jgi:hypothetical protein
MGVAGAVLDEAGSPNRVDDRMQPLDSTRQIGTLEFLRNAVFDGLIGHIFFQRDRISG